MTISKPARLIGISAVIALAGCTVTRNCMEAGTDQTVSAVREESLSDRCLDMMRLASGGAPIEAETQTVTAVPMTRFVVHGSGKSSRFKPDQKISWQCRFTRATMTSFVWNVPPLADDDLKP